MTPTKAIKKEEPKVEVKQNKESGYDGGPCAIIENGRYIRTYDEKTNGKDFKQQATEFCTKTKDRKIVSEDKLNTLKVVYRTESKALPGTFVDEKKVFPYKSYKSAIALKNEKNGYILI